MMERGLFDSRPLDERIVLEFTALKRVSLSWQVWKLDGSLSCRINSSLSAMAMCVPRGS